MDEQPTTAAPQQQVWRPSTRVRRLLGDSAWQFGETFLRLALGLVVNALVARHLSTQGFGVFAYAVAVVGFVAPLARCGLDSVVARDVAAHPELAGGLLRSVLRITLLSGVAGTLLVVGFALFGGHEAALRTGLLVAAFGCLSTPLGIYQGVLKANFRSGALARVRIFLAVAFAAVRATGVYLGWGPAGFIGLTIVEEFCSHAVAFQLCRRHGLLARAAGQAAAWRPLLAEGLPLMVSFLLIALYTRIDLLMVEHFHGARETGLYAAAARISEVWNMIPGIMVGTFLPHFAQIRAGDPERFLRSMRIFAAGLFWGSCAVIVVNQLAAPYLVAILFGADFAGAVPMVKWYVLSFVAVCLGGLLSYWYILEKLNGYLMLASVVGLVVNVVLNLFLIPRSGGSGAAQATAISYTLSVLAPLCVSSQARRMAANVVRGMLLRI